MSPPQSIYEVILARNFTPSEGRIPRLVVVHSMEAPEKPGTARAVAKWFASPLAPKASAHYCIDNREVIQCVKEKDVAWGAPGANRNGVHIEHAGYAAQTSEQWDDAYSTSMLQLSARLCAEVCLRYAIPLTWLSPDDIRSGKAGICGHIDCTKAFRTVGGHTDPGPNFPRDHYIDLVKAAALEMNANET